MHGLQNGSHNTTFCTQIEYLWTSSGNFSASQPFQCLIVSIIKGFEGLRLEFTLHNYHHTLTFYSQVVKILAPGPYVSHQEYNNLPEPTCGIKIASNNVTIIRINISLTTSVITSTYQYGLVDNTNDSK